MNAPLRIYVVITFFSYNVETFPAVLANKFLSFALLLTASTFCFLPNAWSRHLVGGDMSYQYLGQTPGGEKQFRFTLRLYRDCNGGGAPFDDPARIAVYRGAWSNSVLVSSFTVSPPVITPLIVASGCAGNPPQLCLEQGTYTFDRTLPVVAGESYFIVYQRCCHTETISNIIEPGNTGSTVMVELSAEAMSANNSSPVLPPYPVVALCIHHPMHIVQTVTETDNDLVVYNFVAPYAGGGPILSPPQVSSCEGSLPDPPCAPPYMPVLYVAPPYTPTSPMAGDPLVQISLDSGIITGTPNMLGQFLVGIVFQEFRNGVLLSSARREITFPVFDKNAIASKEANPARDIFQLSPNPAQDWISWPAELELTDIQVFDVLGRCVAGQRVQHRTGMDISRLPTGCYRVLGLRRSGGDVSRTLVIAR